MAVDHESDQDAGQGRRASVNLLTTELDFAHRVLQEEARAVAGLADHALADGRAFHRAVGLVVACAEAGGSVLVSGLGKSGLVGSKISATLASLGIPSHPVHPAEAVHGDLGRFRPSDTVICISHSGETDEVVDLAGILRQDGLPIIAVTGGLHDAPTSLERLATVSLRLGVRSEAGAPSLVAPTSSTTATMALGDVLALCAARRRQFSEADFAKRHPGGSLGGLMRPVTDVLRFSVGKNLPVIPDHLSVGEALNEATGAGRRPGALLLIDRSTGRLSGIFTDGDLRRLVLRDPAELDRPVRDVMTRDPRSLAHTSLVRDAVRMVREFRQDEIPIVDADHRPIGLLDVQDLITMRLVKD